MKYVSSCWFCGRGPVYARHKQARPQWLPEVLETAGAIPLCEGCHTYVVGDQWVQLVERIARVRDMDTNRGYHTCAFEASDRVVRFIASDAGEYDLEADR